MKIRNEQPQFTNEQIDEKVKQYLPKFKSIREMYKHHLAIARALHFKAGSYGIPFTSLIPRMKELVQIANKIGEK